MNDEDISMEMDESKFKGAVISLLIDSNISNLIIIDLLSEILARQSGDDSSLEQEISSIRKQVYSDRAKLRDRAVQYVHANYGDIDISGFFDNLK